MNRVEGILHLQYFYDIGSEANLDALRETLGVAKPRRDPAFKQKTPDYVRFERPPVVETLAPVSLPGGGDPFSVKLRYFQFGVVCLEFERAITGDWAELVALSSKWVWSDGADETADKLIAAKVEAVKAALSRPSAKFLREDYAVVELRRVADAEGKLLTAPDLISRHGADIAQIVRGEMQPLSSGERDEVLGSTLSYSPRDLLVVGYAAALVYDQDPDSAAPMLELLEYANTQLLEYRFYDELLTPVLADVYQRSAVRRGFLSQWRGGREAATLNALRLEVMELTERTDNAIKFLSDMFYARAYRLASARIGVPDYRRLVEAKLNVAGELYRFMMDKSHQASGFVLELVVVIILIIDLVILLGGKHK